MQPIQINVAVTVGMSQELNGLLLSLIRPQAAPAAVVVPPAPKKTKATALPVAEPAPIEEPTPAVETAPEPASVPEPAPIEAPTPAPATDPAKKEYTEVDVRAAIDATRRRIEGEDYKEKTDNEVYQKWHRVLTAWFKNTAAISGTGADKPSALPDSESRRIFIAHCRDLHVNEAGELEEGKAPF